MLLKLAALITFSSLTYANFDISYDVMNCSSDGKSCEVRVQFLKADQDFKYINTCNDVDPSTDSLQNCIEDLEVRASRMFNSF